MLASLGGPKGEWNACRRWDEHSGRLRILPPRPASASPERGDRWVVARRAATAERPPTPHPIRRMTRPGVTADAGLAGQQPKGARADLAYEESRHGTLKAATDRICCSDSRSCWRRAQARRRRARRPGSKGRHPNRRPPNPAPLRRTRVRQRPVRPARRRRACDAIQAWSDEMRALSELDPRRRAWTMSVRKSI